MDLPTCPTCKQSVLDEDATDCPFCGAPMKGGSPARAGAVPAPRASAPRSAPPAKLQPGAAGTKGDAKSKATAEKGATPKRSSPADDDPFAVDESIGSKAIPLSPKPAVGKTLEIKCPMCETTGYASPKAAGQQVRCCNAQCLVPIFSAPAPKKAEPPPPPPPPKKPVALYTGIGAFAVLLVGALAWQFGGFVKAPDSLPPLPPMAVTPSVTDGPGVAATDAKKASDAKAVNQAAQQNPKEALTEQALKKLTELNLNVPAIRKAYSRRLSAIAFIESGDLQGGRDQLEQLARIGKQTPFEACLPTVLLAWRQIATSPEEFAKSVADAKRFADALPARGRYAIEAGIGTAAVLAAAGQLDEARKMIAAHQGAPDLKQLAAAYQVVQNDQTYDFDAPLIGRSLGDWLAPLETGVTLILAAHDRWDDAQAWALQSPDPLAKAETTLVWTEAFARQALAADPATDLQRVQAAADGLPATAQARLLARLAAVRWAAGQRDAADESLQQSIQLLSRISAPAPIKIQGAKSLLDWKLPDGRALRLAALAAAELGVVQSQMKQPDAAWNSFQTALRFLRGAAPGLSFTQQRISENKGQGAEKIRGELKSAFQLKTDDQVRLYSAQYKKKLEDLDNAAFQRFLWQTELLEVAARLGLVDQVWDEIQKGEARPEPAEREPLLASAAPIVLADQFGLAGKNDMRQTVTASAQAREKTLRPELQLRVFAEMARQGIDAGKIAETVQQLNESVSDAGALHEASLRLACRLVNAGKIAESLQFVRSFRESLLREDGLYLVAALASRHGHAAEIWKLSASGLGPTETAAVCAGIVTGLAHPATGK